MNPINPMLDNNLVDVLNPGELSLDPIVLLALEQVRQSLSDFATAPDFLAKMQLAFGDNFAPETALSLAEDWVNGDVTFPSIQVLPSAVLNGADGGYASATNTIYLSEELLRKNKLSEVKSAILEEFGHSVDKLLNGSDASGDEGQIFTALVQGISLPELEFQTLKQENDFATIFIDNQAIEIEEARLQKSGGQQTTPFVYSLPLESQLNLVKFNWDNYSIPDEFQITYEGIRIAGDVGLQSGGNRGEYILTKKTSDELIVKVTAPRQGTAWNFTVETLPLEININGFLGDVIEIDLVKEFQNRGISLETANLDPNGFTIESTSNNRGKIAQIDNWQTELQKGKFYFAPTTSGTPIAFNQNRADVGIGESTLIITNNNIEIPIKFNIQDGYQEKVTFDSKKLDIYRQQQRLSYLGFPAQSGNPLTVDGQTGKNTQWAIQLFNSVVGSSRKFLPNQTFSKIAESAINAKDTSFPPRWSELNTNSILGVGIVQGGTLEKWGANWAFNVLRSVVPLISNYNFNLNGASLKKGGNTPAHGGHEAGMDLDIDVAGRGDGNNYVPGNMFFKENKFNTNRWYVEAPGGQVIIRNATTGKYEAADPTSANLTQALRGSSIYNKKIIEDLFVDANNNNQADLDEWLIVDNPNATFQNQNGSPKTGYDLQTVRSLISSLLNVNVNGVTVSLIRFNDPRVKDLDPNRIKFTSNHNGHIHADVLAPQFSPIPLPFSFNSETQNRSPNSEILANSLTEPSPLSVDIASTNDSLAINLTNAIELNKLEGNLNLNGSITNQTPEAYYRFTLGNPVDEDQIEGDYFNTFRDLSLILNQLNSDVDLELIRDLNEDGIRQDDEVIANSSQLGNNDETLELTDLQEGIYYIRLFQKSGETNYNLTLTVPPLPVPPDNAGNTPSNAQDLGTLSGNLTQSDFIGEVDPDDYYRFNITQPSDFSLEVNGLDQGDLAAALGQDTNNDGVIDFDEIIAISDAESNEAEGININGLAEGTYYVWLSRNSGNTDYNLNLSATPAVIPPDLAGSTPSTAFDIGSLNSASNFTDFVGNVDPEDFYRFSLGNVSGLKIELNGLAADADLELAQDKNNDGVIDSDEIISTSDLSGTDAEVIDASALAAGNYFVRVHQYEGDTNYNLSLTPTNPVGSDLLVTRTDATGAVDLGQEYNYTLTVTNNGPTMANNVILTENLPSGVNVIGTTVDAPTLQRNLVDLIKLQLNAGEQVTVDIDARLMGSPLDSGLRLFNSAGTQLAISDNNAAPGESLNRDSYIDFTALVSDTYYVGISGASNFGYNPFVEGSGSISSSAGNYTVEIKVGSGGLTNQAVLGEPNNTILQAVDSGLSSVNPGTFIGTGTIRTRSINPLRVNNGVLTGNLGSLNSGQSATVNLTVGTFSSGGLLSRTNVKADEFDYNLSNNSLVTTKTVNAIISPDADLELTQTINNANPRIGEQVTFTLNLTNKGPGTATVIQVKDVLPGGLGYVSAVADIGSYDSNTGIWTVGNMPPNDTVRLTITASVNSGQLLANTAEVIAVDEGDPDSTPNNNNPNEDDRASVLVDVQNVVPIAQANKTLTVLEDAAPTSLNISAPTDANGDTLTIAVGTIPDVTKGQLFLGNSLIQTGDTLTSEQLTSLVFVPIANANGAAGTFSYTVSDGQGGTAAQTITLAIASVNDVPLAQDDAATTSENTSVTVAVLANDSDPDGDSLSLASFNSTSAQGGTVSRDDNGTPGNLTDDKLLYTPATGFSGTDSFTYTISDGTDTSTATVSITVTSTANQPPQAVNDLATATQNTPLIIPGATLLSNDTDPNQGDILSIAGVSNVSNGSALFDGTNVIFTPASGFIGQAGFDYSISDGKGGNSSARVDITVNPFLGTPGRDTIAGTDLDDIVIGGLGADNLTGKQGKDQFVYQNIRDAGDIIKDFQVTQDKIVLTDLLNSFGYRGSNPIADGYLSFGARGSDTIILIDEDGLAATKRALPFITVEKVALATMQDPSNFIF